jgi:ATP-binding cassette subfamily C protein
VLKTARKLWQLLSAAERRKFRWALAVGTLASALQVVGVGSIFPFVAVMADPAAVHRYRFLAQLQQLLGMAADRAFLLLLGVGSLIVLVASNTALAASHWVAVRFADGVMHRLSVALFASYLRAPYVVHLRRSVAELKRNVLQEAERFSTLLNAVLQCATGLLTLVAVAGVLFYLNPVATVSVLLVFGASYVFIYLFVRRRLARLAAFRLEANRERYRTADEGFGGLKELNVLQRLEPVLQRFDAASAANVRFHTAHAVAGVMPRYLLELMAFGSLMVVALLLMLRGGDVRAAIPLMSVFALAAYRLLPALQQAYNTVVTFRLFSPAVELLARELARVSGEDATQAAASSVLADPPTSQQPLPFRDRIVLENVSFAYAPERGMVLQGISLEIPYRSFVGLVAETGAGKTTVADLILGVLTPTEGRILVDGVEITPENVRGWQRQLGYVPQDVYLAEDTIAANIAFGVPAKARDIAAVEQAAKTAQIHDFIVSLPEGYDTLVGHRGVRLSGGQRQRIGIARALYHKPEVLVLDEATSQLDGLTEAAFMEALEELSANFTLIVIAHRLATVRHADCLFLLDAGRLVASGTYDQLLAGSRDFRALATARA